VTVFLGSLFKFLTCTLNDEYRRRSDEATAQLRRPRLVYM
jgi:hypothetical protein